MWRIEAPADECRAQRSALLEPYARSKFKAESVICIEKSLQLITSNPAPLAIAGCSPAKDDSGYARCSTTNIEKDQW